MGKKPIIRISQLKFQEKKMVGMIGTMSEIIIDMKGQTLVNEGEEGDDLRQVIYMKAGGSRAGLDSTHLSNESNSYSIPVAMVTCVFWPSIARFVSTIFSMVNQFGSSNSQERQYH